MILASSEMIHASTEKGTWGTRTFIYCFKANAEKNSDHLCPVDPPAGNPVGKVLNKKFRTDIQMKPEKKQASGAHGV